MDVWGDEYDDNYDDKYDELSLNGGRGTDNHDRKISLATQKT